MMTQPQILIIEDEAALRRFLVPTLEAQGYRVEVAEGGHEGLRQARTHNPDLVLLDLGLPDLDGLEVLRQLRGWSRKPILIISARHQEGEKVAALDLGADDYLTKPFGAAELLARIRVALRHAARPAQDTPLLVLGALRLDLERRDVSVDGTPVHLTPLEYRLLEALARRAGQVVTHAQLLNEVWGPAGAGQTHYLRIYMGTLRRKIEVDPTRPRYLITEPSIGYRLNGEGSGNRPGPEME
ncbi:response regulator [Mesoterricola sediminis]|uniref:DNA-binding response regulator n=1 Tax=Mesoterricola sediminis TaxID=2927980 RepID=A0AA48KCS6_9BACT|nr:response regulator [Mesoterricola sediminis]BDU75637.1 DNA-binding response regulator [Mesoterricola sediminis]